MTDLNEFEHMIRDHCRARQRAARTKPEFDRKVLASALNAQRQNQQETTAPAESGVGRFLMQGRKTQLATAAVVLTAVVLGVSVFRDSPRSAYALGQTIDAMKRIETVYIKGEFYKQGEFECWMRFDGDPDRPTHVWLGRSGYNLCKICSPKGVFGLNKRTNRIHFASRDERGKSWIPRFGSLFRDMVRQAGRNDAIRISDNKDGIRVHIDTSQREQEFLVDAQTKLPVRFTTLRDDNPTEMMRKTLAVKNLTEIRYNEQPPEGIFERPADAVVVDQEVDCMVDPDSGLVVGDMTRAEACREIVEQACQALIDLDAPKLESLALFFRLWPAQIWDQVRQMKAAGQWVQGYEITGEPYQEGDLWYVPTEIKGPNGKTEIQTSMIKFYEFDGVTRAFCIGSKEKGVVD